MSEYIYVHVIGGIEIPNIERVGFLHMGDWHMSNS